MTYLEPYKKKLQEKMWRIFQFYCQATGNFVTILGLLREKFQYRDFTISWWWIALTDLFVTAGYNVVNKRYNKIHLSTHSWEWGVTQLPSSGELLLAVKCGSEDLQFLTEYHSFEKLFSLGQIWFRRLHFLQILPPVADSFCTLYLSSHICLSPFPVSCFITLT